MDSLRLGYSLEDVVSASKRSTIVAISSVRSSVSGNSVWREEAYWNFDKDGPIGLDANDKIQKELLPKGFAVVRPAGTCISSLR
jgi:hypothetical protein